MVFFILLYYIRIAIQFFFPIHDSFTSYTKLNEAQFDRLLKYFCVTSFAIAIGNIISFVFWNDLLEVLYLMISITLIIKKYKFAEISFDWMYTKFNEAKESKLNKLADQIENYLSLALKTINDKVITPIKKQLRKYFMKKIEQELSSDE